MRGMLLEQEFMDFFSTEIKYSDHLYFIFLWLIFVPFGSTVWMVRLQLVKVSLVMEILY